MKVSTNPVHILLIIFYIVVKHSKPKINVKLLAHLQLHILVITTLFTIQIEQEFYNYVFSSLLSSPGSTRMTKTSPMLFFICSTNSLVGTFIGNSGLLVTWKQLQIKSYFWGTENFSGISEQIWRQTLSPQEPSWISENSLARYEKKIKISWTPSQAFFVRVDTLLSKIAWISLGT